MPALRIAFQVEPGRDRLRPDAPGREKGETACGRHRPDAAAARRAAQPGTPLDGAQSDAERCFLRERADRARASRGCKGPGCGCQRSTADSRAARRPASRRAKAPAPAKRPPSRRQSSQPVSDQRDGRAAGLPPASRTASTEGGGGSAVSGVRGVAVKARLRDGAASTGVACGIAAGSRGAANFGTRALFAVRTAGDTRLANGMDEMLRGALATGAGERSPLCRSRRSRRQHGLSRLTRCPEQRRRRGAQPQHDPAAGPVARESAAACRSGSWRTGRRFFGESGGPSCPSQAADRADAAHKRRWHVAPPSSQ